MTGWDETSRVAVGGVALELPVALAKRQDKAIDSAAEVFEGGGLTVIVDPGPFSDNLTSFVGRPEYEEQTEKIAGTTGRLVSFRTPEEGTYTLATHLPGPTSLTVVVRAQDSVPKQVPRDIVHSLQPLG